MGHHCKANMLAVRAALDELTLRRTASTARAIYLYGEGWNFGEVANNALFEQATQGNLGGTGIGTFNDRLRDAVHGGSPFDDDPRIQGFGTGLVDRPERRRRSTARPREQRPATRRTTPTWSSSASPATCVVHASAPPRPATSSAATRSTTTAHPPATPTSRTR